MMFELAQPVRFCASNHSWLAHAGIGAAFAVQTEGQPLDFAFLGMIV